MKNWLRLAKLKMKLDSMSSKLMKYYTVEVSNTKDGINNRVLNNVGEDIVKAKSNFYTRAGQLLGSTLLVETCLILQDGVGNQIEKVYQKFEIEPETEEVTAEE